ncbi:hypothetical protein EVAR_92542_1 [Eumeta japonica]|uniref:Uncharacterized protein n=1 Tax=Eumeta variegata TaxID=151549 RepID=A0A4C1SZ37_EUMVA|nr:hypothetical protein EVAR_92542_1 [Eumeta japonica]
MLRIFIESTCCRSGPFAHFSRCDGHPAEKPTGKRMSASQYGSGGIVLRRRYRILTGYLATFNCHQLLRLHI